MISCFVYVCDVIPLYINRKYSIANGADAID